MNNCILIINDELINHQILINFINLIKSNHRYVVKFPVCQSKLHFRLLFLDCSSTYFCNIYF